MDTSRDTEQHKWGNLDLSVTSQSWSNKVGLNLDELVLTQFCFLLDLLLVILFMFVLIAIAFCMVFYDTHDFLSSFYLWLCDCNFLLSSCS
jgi:hypothetical protein